MTNTCEGDGEPDGDGLAMGDGDGIGVGLGLVFAVAVGWPQAASNPSIRATTPTFIPETLRSLAT
jgi:hypothetical protein